MSIILNSEEIVRVITFLAEFIAEKGKGEYLIRIVYRLELKERRLFIERGDKAQQIVLRDDNITTQDICQPLKENLTTRGICIDVETSYGNLIIFAK